MAQGLTPDDEDEEDLEDGQAEGEQVTDVKAILEDLDKRYCVDHSFQLVLSGSKFFFRVSRK